ncbi:DUF4156 domain-containing protein [Nitrosomonas sp. sh817]|uniref:DUF4156 domain-containing protein n=1 Tax=Nitrosomonas sp. sh817 TaxID=3070658 RepID=UPI0027DAEB4C|nr:DUF4156 domain-containing protein [Nitrosomonas sp. sh817]WMJ07379.1 DUF4156 domain-containing protein [Nitrosomonas sp. sh817]
MDVSIPHSKLIFKMLLIFSFVCFANGFALAEQSKSVIIMVGAEGPSGCELLGKVIGSSKEGEVQANNVPYTERLMKARNSLVDVTQKLGGDTVHIVRSNNSGKYEVPGGEKEIIHIGNAYRCQ